MNIKVLVDSNNNIKEIFENGTEQLNGDNRVIKGDNLTMGYVNSNLVLKDLGDLTLTYKELDSEFEQTPHTFENLTDESKQLVIDTLANLE